MGTVIGDLLPLAVGVAVSPVPIIAVILMLFAPRAGSVSTSFMAGWIVGIVVATLLFVWLASTTDMSSDGEPSTAASWIRLLLGVALLLASVRQWRARPEPGQAASLPKWLATIDTFTPGKAAGLAFLLSAINPKNLAMCAAAGIAIATGNLGGGQIAVAVVVFTALAACTVAVPVVGYAVARDRMRGPLDDLKAWLQANSSAVMSVLLLVIGVVLIGKGLGSLF